MSRKSEANGGALGYKNEMNQSSSGRTSVNATSGQILYYNSGTITGSPNMTFDGTTTTISSLFVNTFNVTTISAPNLNITGVATMSSAIVNHQLSVSGLNVYSSIINLSSELQDLSSYVYSIPTSQNWSQYPATQNVDMSNNALLNLNINNTTISDAIIDTTNTAVAPVVTLSQDNITLFLRRLPATTISSGVAPTPDPTTNFGISGDLWIESGQWYYEFTIL